MTDAGGTISARMNAQRSVHDGWTGVQVRPPAVQSGNLLASLLALAGIILPTELQVFLAGAKFTPGRLGAALLFLPALFTLFKRGRRTAACDYLAFATAGWMIFATLSSVGVRGLSSAGGDALDFLGGYLIARAYVFGRPSLDMFIRVLRAFAGVAILFAIADNLSGRLIVHETFGAIVHAAELPQAGYRNNVVRAASTFDHAILFGVFCALTAAIMLYWEESWLRRIFAVGICLLGCILSRSSAALMDLSIILAVYTYDRAMIRYSGRWKALWTVIAVAAMAFSIISEHPLDWIISHLTLDPQTGYFRFMIWDAALGYIAQSPFIGYAYELFNDNIIDGSVDSIWLLQTLRFGVPMFVLFFLTNISALSANKYEFGNGSGDLYMDRMRRAFTLVILIFMFSGLTVHFWNYMWMFWGLCLGIRVSIKEISLQVASE